LALAGFFHTNYLLLGFISFTLAHLFIGFHRLIQRLIEQFVLSVIVLIMVLPMLLEVSLSGYGSTARNIMFFIRSPHHYNTISFIKTFIPFFAWHGVAFATLSMMKTYTESLRKFKAITFAFFLPVFFAMFLTTLVFIPVISQFFFFRLAPFSLALARIVICVFVLKALYEFNRGKYTVVLNRFALVGFYLCCAILFFLSLKYQRILLTILIVIVCAPLIFYCMEKEGFDIFLKPFRKALPLFLSAIFVFMMAQTGLPNWNKSLLKNGKIFSDSKKQLFNWARLTPRESRFAVSPSMKNFRLQSQRAIVVDWKSTPIIPSEWVQWYKRICDISGGVKVLSKTQADRQYANISPSHIQYLKDKYNIQYAVFKKPLREKLKEIKIAFENENYVVLQP
jgi:hypothetical protein